MNELSLNMKPPLKNERCHDLNLIQDIQLFSVAVKGLALVHKNAI